jgi:hypothetical protein
MKECPNCSKKFDNLGVHLRFCGNDRSKEANITIDKYMGKSLSSTLDGIREVLRPFTYTIETTTTEQNGTYDEVELKIRIPIRR